MGGLLKRVVDDIRATACAASSGGGAAGVVQVAAAREADADGAVAMDVCFAGARQRPGALVAGKAVAVADNLFDKVAGTAGVDLEGGGLSCYLGIGGSAHFQFKVLCGYIAVIIGGAGKVDVDFL